MCQFSQPNFTFDSPLAWCFLLLVPLPTRLVSAAARKVLFFSSWKTEKRSQMKLLLSFWHCSLKDSKAPWMSESEEENLMFASIKTKSLKLGFAIRERKNFLRNKQAACFSFPRDELRVLTLFKTGRVGEGSFKLSLMVMKRDVLQWGERSNFSFVLFGLLKAAWVTIYFHKQAISLRMKLLISLKSRNWLFPLRLALVPNSTSTSTHEWKLISKINIAAKNYHKHSIPQPQNALISSDDERDCGLVEGKSRRKYTTDGLTLFGNAVEAKVFREFRSFTDVNGRWLSHVCCICVSQIWLEWR